MLPVHGPGKQNVIFKKGQEGEIMQRIEEGKTSSALVAFLELNKRDPKANEFTYEEVRSKE